MSAVIKEPVFNLKGLKLKATSWSSPPLNEEPEYRFSNNYNSVVIKRETSIEVDGLSFFKCWTLYLNDTYIDHDYNRHDLADRHGLRILYPKIK